MANRILSVGSSSRASKIACHFDPSCNVREIESSRGFKIITGTFDSVPISIVATQMGIANMDFVVRETRNVVKGPMAIVRYGTCGTLQSCISPGSVVVASPGSVMVTRCPDAFLNDSIELKEKQPYFVSQIASSDSKLSEMVLNELKKNLGPENPVHTGLNATACSFYSSQGRLDPNFDDRNENLHENLMKKHPNVATMEMETFHLLDLARCSRNSIKASAAVIVVANRPLGQVASGDIINELENNGGRAILQALAHFKL